MHDLAIATLNMFGSVTILYCVAGVALGIIVGAMPGISGSMLIALALPFTFYMDGETAVVLLVSMFVGSVSGGLLTAILLRIPGDPSAIMTTFDGYPMAARGEAKRALSYAIFASLVGGLLSAVVLVTFTRPLSKFAVIFGPFEYFALVMLAFALIVTISGRSLSAGLLSAGLGILASMPGIDASTGTVRLTFGFSALDAGFSTIAVFIGLFAINQVIDGMLSSRTEQAALRHSGVTLLRLRDMRGHWLNLLRSSAVGIGIGILPGIGATIASVVSYTLAKVFSRQPERFGTGIPDGIVASEAANNGSVGGSLVPLIALGIPGSVTGAILVGALILHGLQPGPLLFVTNPGIVQTIFATTFVANIFMFLLLVVFGGLFCRIALVPFPYLGPLIILACVLGAYAGSSRVFDIWTALGFGLIGWLMERSNVPLGPFIIAFVLSPMAEEFLRAAIMISGGDPASLLAHPIAAVLLGIASLIFVASLWRKEKPQASGPGTQS